MARLLRYYAHPGHRMSHANKAMHQRARGVEGITQVDLYEDYPRFDINVEREQQRLVEHDVILFQFPIFWYSTPSILKEWQDLVLEHGFAYGDAGEALAGKKMMLAVTAAGPEEAYQKDGYQHHELRTFLTPLEQTAHLCGMEFVPPYVLFGSLRAPAEGRLPDHVEGFAALLEALRDDRFDFKAAAKHKVLGSETLPVKEKV